MTQKRAFKFFALAILFSFLNCHHVYAQESKTVLLSPTYDIHSNPYYDWVIRKKSDPDKVEKAKIEYLIERIRQSPYQFVRNGMEHTSSEAAEHLTHKYRKAKDQIKTAEEFIQYVATRSSTTQKLYLMKLKDGNTIPMGEILKNELKVLEENLTDSVSQRTHQNNLDSPTGSVTGSVTAGDADSEEGASAVAAGA